MYCVRFFWWCYAFVFLAEILISLFYFANKFERKSSKKFLLFSVVIVYVLLYLSRLLNLTLVNLIAFFACNFFLLYFCYFISVKSCIFHCSILLIFMAITEIIVLFVFKIKQWYQNFCEKNKRIANCIYHFYTPMYAKYAFLKFE